MEANVQNDMKKKKKHLNTHASLFGGQRLKFREPWFCEKLWSTGRDGEGMRGGYCISIHVAFKVIVQR